MAENAHGQSIPLETNLPVVAKNPYGKPKSITNMLLKFYINVLNRCIKCPFWY